MRTLRLICAGVGDLPGWGSHPGTIPLAILSCVGGLGGGWKLALITLGVFSPLYLKGAYDRADEYERNKMNDPTNSHV